MSSAVAGAPAGGLGEAARLHWREDASESTIRRDERRWTVWTAWIAGVFIVPGAALIAIEPLTFPAALACWAHAWAVPWIQAQRGARQVVALGEGRAGDEPAERIALGLLGDLVGHEERELLARTGLALQRGSLGVWLLGQRGAMLVRSRGRRVDCWCVRVAEAEGLPTGDRVAHLLLALREDELGFAKVANLGFSGARWRVRRRLAPRARPALDRARELARGRD